MKLLTLIRHAKSSWDDPGLSDIDRPLNNRGSRDAPKMGRRLAAIDFAPGVFLCSPARRTRQTAQAILHELQIKPELRIEPELYGADEATLIHIIRLLDDALIHVALVGHNPGLTALANLLGASMIDNLPTAGLVRLEFDVEVWRDSGPGNARLIEFDYPKKSKHD